MLSNRSLRMQMEPICLCRKTWMGMEIWMCSLLLLVDDKIAWYENLSGEGCIDPSACNFDATMWIDNGSCCYTDCGCTDPIAEISILMQHVITGHANTSMAA